MNVRIFTSPIVTTYAFPQHPEAPTRVSRTADRLKANGWTLERPTVKATEKHALLAHSRNHWNALESGLYFDPDTPHFDGVVDVALASLSGCLSAFEAAREGTPAFSLMRPPGHHAGRERIAGFCYLNNVAVTVERALQEVKRVAILDIDAHHGDGTESIMMDRDGVLFVSLHQAPLYPGTGLTSRGNCHNFPLPPGTSERDYLPVLERALTLVKGFQPEMLAISAGFDTYKECPIAQFKLEATTYRRIGRMIADTDLPRFAALEGGYADAMPELIENFLTGFGE